MIEKLFVFASTKERQREAPMLRERERYLSYLLDQGVSKSRIRTIASMLLNVVRIMDIKEPRIVSREEIRKASELWTVDTKSRRTIPSGGRCAMSFFYTALRWFRFQSLLLSPATSSNASYQITAAFTEYILARGGSIETIRSYRSRTREFLNHVFERISTLRSIDLSHIDRFLDVKKASGCLPMTIASYCAALRAFFRYAETVGLTPSRIATNIRSPQIRRYARCCKGPRWSDVRRMLNEDFGDTPAQLRTSAIISLCAIYGLRRGEVAGLLLSDFDWRNEILAVRRSKTGRIQQFPLLFEVGETIIRYLTHGRPPCVCRNLFVSLRPPSRPIDPTILWNVVALRMKRLGIKSVNFGAHSLRHACATELLRKGSSFQSIADFLGHRNMKSVGIYAKV